MFRKQPRLSLQISSSLTVISPIVCCLTTYANASESAESADPPSATATIEDIREQLLTWMTSDDAKTRLSLYSAVSELFLDEWELNNQLRSPPASPS